MKDFDDSMMDYKEDYDSFQSNDLENFHEEVQYDEDENPTVEILSFLSTWFIRIGMGLAVIVLLYYFIKGKFLTAVLYVLGLVLAFIFGYFFMYFLDKFVSMN